MWKTSEGSTGRLLQLCFGYFFFYVVTGVVVRYFQFYPGGPQLNNIEYLVYSTTGGASLALIVVLILRWYKFETIRPTKLLGIVFPSEFYYIAPAGFCTAIIIATTTLMYSIKGVSVMVAMVLMRASVIIIGRIVDAIQIHQGILKKKVYLEENMGILFALLAVSVKMFWSLFTVNTKDFDFLVHPAAMAILCTYIAAYAIRIYIMNYFKNTRPKGVKLNNKSYFAIEQIFSCIVLVIAAVVIFYWPTNLGGGIDQIQEFHNAIANASSWWLWAIIGGTAFGIVAFFSVFIFMFKGRTATFAGLVNRLTSLLAGTTATLISWVFLKGGFPEIQDWLSLVFIIVAIGFISVGERRRIRELVVAHEVKK
jgi:hypothetical protein